MKNLQSSDEIVLFVKTRQNMLLKTYWKIKKEKKRNRSGSPVFLQFGSWVDVKVGSQNLHRGLNSYALESWSN